MTVLEALKQVQHDLSNIPVKIGDYDAIGIPIKTAVLNIGAVIDALENQPAQPAPKEEEEKHDEEAGH